MKITAPTGMVITKLTYVESGVGTIAGTDAIGAIAESVQLIANGTPLSPLGAAAFGGPGSYVWGPLTQTFDFGAGVAEVDFAVINTLFAFALTGSATNEKLGASIEATLAPIPLPPAAWMLGSALVGLVTVGRRKLAA